jgi:hypothetical protein
MRLTTLKRKHRSDAHEVHQRHGAPQPLTAVDFLRWSAVYVHESRCKQRELNDPPEHEGSLLSGAKVSPILVARHDDHLPAPVLLSMPSTPTTLSLSTWHASVRIHPASSVRHPSSRRRTAFGQCSGWADSLVLTSGPPRGAPGRSWGPLRPLALRPYRS